MDAIIHRLCWHIKIKNTQQSALQAQKEVAALSGSAGFLKMLEEALSKILPEDAHYSIDKLELDLGKLPTAVWTNEDKKRLSQALVKSLYAAKIGSEKPNNQLVKTSAQQHVADVFRSFIVSGNLPNQLPASARTVNDVALWLAAKLTQKDVQNGLAALLKNDHFFAESLGKWPLKGLFHSLIKKLEQPPKGAQWFVVVVDLLRVSKTKASSETAHFRVLAWQFLLAEDSNRNAFFAEAQKIVSSAANDSQPQAKEKFTSILRKLEKETSVLPTLSEEKAPVFRAAADQKTDAPSAYKTENTFFIRNAGFVLVAPFLPMYFAQLGFVKENKITKPEKALRSLALLDVADAHETGADLALFKVLCGMPINDLVLPNMRTSAKQRNEAQNLLVEIIKHWKVLKNTSPASLRSGFFWREGSLKQHPDKWELTVETKAQDVLLAHLPWGIGIIKLPWMSKPLHVNWG